MTHLVDHVALRVPAFVAIVAVDLHKLLQYRTITSCALRCEPRRVVKMAVHVIFMLIVRILRTKDSRANRTRKMLDMVLFVWIRERDVSSTFLSIQMKRRRKYVLQAVM
jgi:hypothetical protein